MDPWACWAFSEELGYRLFFFPSHSCCSVGVYLSLTLTTHPHPIHQEKGKDLLTVVWWSENLGPGLSVTAKESLTLIKASLFLLPGPQFFLVWKMIGLDQPISISWYSKMLGLPVRDFKHAVKILWGIVSLGCFSWAIWETWLWQEQMSFYVSFLNRRASFYPL